MEIKHIGVVVSTEKGEVYQVLLNKKQTKKLLKDLASYFDNGIIAVSNNKLKGIELATEKEREKNKKNK